MDILQGETMTAKQQGITTYVVGAIVMFSAVLFGNGMQQELRSLSLEAFAAEHGVLGQLRFFSFAFGFPLGLGFGLIGVTIMSGANRKHILAFAITTIVAMLAAGFIPELFGRSLSAVYFGGGGYSIMVLSLISVWFWGQYRSNVAVVKRVALDLQGLGYLCFAVAMWNLCGAATMPSFSLEPDKMIQMNSQAFAIGQMKTVMALFICGWVFTLFGFKRAAKDAAK
jgi:hypothetical protein